MRDKNTILQYYKNTKVKYKGYKRNEINEHKRKNRQDS